MKEVDALRDYIEKQIEWQNKTLERILDQTTRTNGRVGLLEQLVPTLVEKVNAIFGRLTGHDREIRDLKRSTGSKSEREGENRGLTQRDLWMVLATVAIVVTVLAFFGMLKTPGVIR